MRVYLVIFRMVPKLQCCQTCLIHSEDTPNRSNPAWEPTTNCSNTGKQCLGNGFIIGWLVGRWLAGGGATTAVGLVIDVDSVHLISWRHFAGDGYNRPPPSSLHFILRHRGRGREPVMILQGIEHAAIDLLQSVLRQIVHFSSLFNQLSLLHVVGLKLR